MKVSRRQFLKTAVGAAVAAGLPAVPLPYARSQVKQGVRELQYEEEVIDWKESAKEAGKVLLAITLLAGIVAASVAIENALGLEPCDDDDWDDDDC